MAAVTELHIPTKTSRDTLIEFRARSRASLVEALYAAIRREQAKGEHVTWGSGMDEINPTMATTAPQVSEGSFHTAVIRIRRDPI